MSLKVQRGFKTYSEDSIIELNAGLRRKFDHQDLHARRLQEGSAKLSFVAKFAIVAVVVVVASAAFRPLMNLVQSFS